MTGAALETASFSEKFSRGGKADAFHCRVLCVPLQRTARVRKVVELQIHAYGEMVTDRLLKVSDWQ